jgi:hypothetical protein
MPASVPSTLLTPDAVSGHALARLLASQLPANPGDGAASMAEHLRTTAATRGVDAGLATAIYFHAIALANQGWKNRQ